MPYNNCPGFVAGDNVKMIVDFDTEELRFVINGTDYGKVKDLNPEYQYRAAVSLILKDDSLQLIS